MLMQLEQTWQRSRRSLRMNDGQFFVLMIVILVCACLIGEGLGGGRR